MESEKTTAVKAFAYFAEGWASGDFTNYLAMLAEDFTFYFPEGEQAGEYYAAEGKQMMVEKCLGHARRGERLKLYPPYRVTANAQTTVFEFKAEGELDGKYYLGSIAISFDTAGDKICGFREYYGFSR